MLFNFNLLFILILFSSASQVQATSQRKTLTLPDVLAALEDMMFEDMIDPIKESLEGEQQFNPIPCIFFFKQIYLLFLICLVFHSTFFMVIYLHYVKFLK